MIDFNSSTLCVDDPEIREVLDLESGLFLSAQHAIGNDYDKLEKLRMVLAESSAEDRCKYVCPICGVGVYIVCVRRNNEKRFFFRHRSENGNCPAITRGELSKEEIEARKYNGAKESWAHIRMKEIIAESLAHDPDFSDIKIEKIWKGQDRASWRKPDVQALWRGKLPVAFEIQLSTTFLHVIAERRLFYKAEGGLLCWIFKSFDSVSAKMMQDDVFFNNNHNLFLASEDTLKFSNERKSLVLDGRWTEPVAINGHIMEQWNGQFVSFSELTQDQKQQRIFFFDYEKQKSSLTMLENTEALKQKFESWWGNNGYNPQPDDIWLKFRSEFEQQNVILPDSPSEVQKIFNALYSAKAGKSVGWQHKKFISVAHTVAGSHKNILQIFRVALLVYNRRDQINSEDSEKKWEKKVKDYKEKISAGDTAYNRETKFDSLIAFLFPEVWSKIQELDSKARQQLKKSLASTGSA